MKPKLSTAALSRSEARAVLRDKTFTAAFYCILFDSALLLEHGDLELLDALLYIVFSVVVLSDDVGLDALRVFVEIDYVVEIRTLYNERSCCAAPVEPGNRNTSLSYLVDTVYIINVKVSPAVCFYNNSVRTRALGYDCCSP